MFIFHIGGIITKTESKLLTDVRIDCVKIADPGIANSGEIKGVCVEVSREVLSLGCSAFLKRHDTADLRKLTWYQNLPPQKKKKKKKKDIDKMNE